MMPSTSLASTASAVSSAPFSPAIFVNPGIGGVGVTDYLATDTSVKALEYSFSAQMTAQIYGVLTAVILSAVVSYVALMICKFTTGLRVPEQEEREGLDIGSHGERAYS